VGDDVLDDDRRGNGAEDDPEADDGDADSFLQIGSVEVGQYIQSWGRS